MSSDEDLYEDSGNDSPYIDDDDDFPDYESDGEDEAGPSGLSGGGAGGGCQEGTVADDDFEYEVLSTEQIVRTMTENIQAVIEVVQLPPTTVRILLNHFKWNKAKLMERYYGDSEEQEKMFKDAKVVSPLQSKAGGSGGSKKSSDSCECEICCLTLPKKMMTSLECGHLYCNACWGEYITVKVMEDGASQIVCPTPECGILVDDKSVMALIEDPRTKLRYQQLITNSFVQCARLLQWCPSPDCTNAVKASSFEPRQVKCRCGHLFCFGCLENWHDPVRCNIIKKWIKKCNDDSETCNWISANTKECPKCKAIIEKDGGCNHMVCKNVSCKYDFCWVCLGPWEPHGSQWYNCNRYDEEVSKMARQGQQKSREDLERYLFYCNRYMNHNQSMKLENKLYAMVKEKMEEMQQHNMSWIEVQFLQKAVDILCDCRRTLMYTYVFAYYLRKNNQCDIFEENQKDLESATEKLSEYLERDISAENLVDIKQKVQDKYRYCDLRRKKLLDHVHEGYEKDHWMYSVDVEEK